MTVTIQRAKALCTASELELVHWSTRKRVEDLSEARLLQKISRARKLRNKFRDLGDRQRREARGKGKPQGRTPAKGNDATRVKQQLFQETLARFEDALAARRAADAKAAAKVSKKTSKKKASKKKASKKKTAKKTTKKAVAPKPVSKKTSKKKITKKQLAKKASRAMSSVHAASATPVPAASVGAVASRQTSWKAVSDTSVGKRKSVRFQKAGQPKIQGHVSSRTRKNQAKRDARG